MPKVVSATFLEVPNKRSRKRGLEARNSFLNGTGSLTVGSSEWKISRKAFF